MQIGNIRVGRTSNKKMNLLLAAVICFYKTALNSKISDSSNDHITTPQIYLLIP